MKRFACVLAVLAIVGLAVSSASATMIYPVNNGFELPVVSSADKLQSITVPGWTATGPDNGTYILDWAWAGGLWGPYSGIPTGSTQSLMLQHSDGSAYQDVVGFLAGPATVSFYSTKVDAGKPSNSIEVKLDDTVLTFGGSNTVTPPDDQTVRLYMSDPITVTAGAHKLTFSGMTGGDARSSVDNVSITTIPEPSALVLLATGLVGLLCYAWRKRK